MNKRVHCNRYAPARTLDDGRGRDQDLGPEYSNNFLDKRLSTKPKIVAEDVLRPVTKVMTHPGNDVVIEVEWAPRAIEHTIQVDLGEEVTRQHSAVLGQELDESHFPFVKIRRSEIIVGRHRDR